VPFSGLSRTEKEDLSTGLINKFLKIIDRERCTPKLMVESNEPPWVEKTGSSGPTTASDHP